MTHLIRLESILGFGMVLVEEGGLEAWVAVIRPTGAEV